MTNPQVTGAVVVGGGGLWRVFPRFSDARVCADGKTHHNPPPTTQEVMTFMNAASRNGQPVIQRLGASRRHLAYAAAVEAAHEAVEAARGAEDGDERGEAS